MPNLPNSFYAPVAIVLEGYELTALTDAILIYDLMAEGCISEVVELMDKSDDGGYIDSMVQTLIDVREKIDKARAPNHREMRRWMAEMKEWENSLDNQGGDL